MVNVYAEQLILELHNVEVFRFDGPFILKSGIESPFYVDLRVLISFPELLSLTATAMVDMLNATLYDCVCGVPYTALPIATAISLSKNIPMVIKRKEGAKAYGTKKEIEGRIYSGQKCLVIEDLVTSGMSVCETIDPLRAAGLIVNDVCVVLDRQQGGRKNLQSRSVELHSLMTMTDVITVLHRRCRIGTDVYDLVKEFIASNQTDQMAPLSHPMSTIPYGSRADLAKNSKGQQLLSLLEQKQTNLCLSADLLSCADILAIADKVGPYICMIKTHIDIITDFTPQFCSDLRSLAKQHNFMIWEDRKFADIGNTVLHQFTGGIYNIASWADFTNAHSVSGPGIIEGLKQGSGQAQGACQAIFMLAEMSSAGNLANGAYTDATLQMSEAYDDFVCGFVCQKALSKMPGMIHVTPGVQLQTGVDSLGQQFQTPEKVIGEDGSDVIIVGRGITLSENPVQACLKYRERGWNAYLSRVNMPPNSDR